jgi:ketosteroid isomerase-like protein
MRGDHIREHVVRSPLMEDPRSGRLGRGYECLVLAVLASALATPAAAGEDPVGAIRAVIERQEADWNRGDLDAFLAGYWNSPQVVFQSGGSRFDGWEAMRDRYRKRYKAEGKAMGKLSFSKLEVELLGPEAALVRGGWRLAMSDGSTPGGLFTLVFRKFADGWKIVHDHTSSEEPARAKSP